MNIRDQLRSKWLASKGFLAPSARRKIPKDPAAKEENKQSAKPGVREPYRMGDRPNRRKGLLKNA